MNKKKMKILLSGEGKTDLGELSHGAMKFKKGPLAYLVEKILEENNVSHFQFQLIPKTELVKRSKKLKKFRLAGKKGSADFRKNAQILGSIALT